MNAHLYSYPNAPGPIRPRLKEETNLECWRVFVVITSTVSRQLKSYQNLALKNDMRNVKILLVAPEFSDDFVTDCEMDTEMNLSLVTALTLSNIFDAFKMSKYQEFPRVLFRDILINEERILKALSK